MANPFGITTLMTLQHHLSRDIKKTIVTNGVLKNYYWRFYNLLRGTIPRKKRTIWRIQKCCGMVHESPAKSRPFFSAHFFKGPDVSMRLPSGRVCSLQHSVRLVFLPSFFLFFPLRVYWCIDRATNLRPDAELIGEMIGVSGVVAPGVAAHTISSRICASLPVLRLFYPQTPQEVGAVINKVCF